MTSYTTALTLRALNLVRMWDADSPLNHPLAVEQQVAMTSDHESAIETVVGLMNIVNVILKLENEAGRSASDLIELVETRANEDS